MEGYTVYSQQAIHTPSHSVFHTIFASKMTLVERGIMPTITVETTIQASVERCFDAARDIGLHCQTVAHTGERAVAGVTYGLIGLGQSVTFEGVHFGVRQRFTAKVTHFERPTYFVDEMTKGAFRSMRHRHGFLPVGQGTLMRDIVEWTSPFGILGLLVDTFVLKKYMGNLIRHRGFHLKQAIEMDVEKAQ